MMITAYADANEQRGMHGMLMLRKVVWLLEEAMTKGTTAAFGFGDGLVPW